MPASTSVTRPSVGIRAPSLHLRPPSGHQHHRPREDAHALEKACTFIENLVAHGDDILLVGTKRQAQELIREAATATGMPYVTTRWMGGTLTNFETIKKSLAKYKKYQAMDASGELGKFSSKEESAIRREMARMTRNFDGIIGLTALPRAMFVIDTGYEEIAVAEAKRRHQCVGMVDTNSDPTQLTLRSRVTTMRQSVRIIIETIVAPSRPASAIVNRATPAENAAAASTGEVDLSKVVIPAGGKEVTEDKLSAKKRPVRSAAGTNKATVTTDEV